MNGPLITSREENEKKLNEERVPHNAEYGTYSYHVVGPALQHVTQIMPLVQLNAIPCQSISRAGLSILVSAFCSSVAKIVTVGDVVCCEAAEVKECSCHRQNAIEKVGLRRIGDLLETRDVVE